jgi:hypothetical protein
MKRFFNRDWLLKLRRLCLIRHCEEHSDEAISKLLITTYQIAALRSQ